MLFARGKKEGLAAALHQTGLTGLLSRTKTDRLTIFNYHRIRPDGPFETPFDEKLFGPTESEFSDHLVWLKQHFRILSEDDLLELLARGERPREPTAMLTFDDGYRDNYTRARPILERHGVPAIFFIPSGLIDERQLGWWDQISYLLKRTRKRTILVQDQTFALENMNAAVRQLLGWMKLKPEDQTKALVEQLSAACEVPLPSAEERNAEIMGWDEIRRCPDSGIAIGSHTHSHRVLATLPSEQQATELSRSKELIESKIGRPVRSLAYPVGGRAHFTPTTEKLAKDAGYAVAFSFGGDDCINRWGAITPFDVRRFSPPDSLALLAATAAMPALFARTWRLPFRG